MNQERGPSLAKNWKQTAITLMPKLDCRKRLAGDLSMTLDGDPRGGGLLNVPRRLNDATADATSTAMSMRMVESGMS